MTRSILPRKGMSPWRKNAGEESGSPKEIIDIVAEK
jgi:hypothetical protein